jgi:hypothetical protein
VALLNLSKFQLETKAAELYRMADNARTTDTRDALRRLAIRFAQLAQARTTEGDSAATIRLWGAPCSPDQTNSVDG